MIKMKQFVKIVFVVVQLTLTHKSFSQLVVDAQFRTRTMLNHGYVSIPEKNQDAAFHTSQRTRLNFNYKDSFYETRISVQDIRVWGDDNIYTATGFFGNSNSFTVFEAWMKFYINSKLNVKIGRQIWKYDDERILAERNWLNYGLSYDGITISRASDKHKIDIGLSYNSNKEDLFGNDYRMIIGYKTNSLGEQIPIYDAYKLNTVNYLYYSYKFSENVYASFISVLTGAQSLNSPKLIYAKTTNGLNIFSKSDLVKGKFSIFYQYGKSQVGKNVSAYLIAAAIGRDILPDKISLNIGIDIISGNNIHNSEIDFSKTDNTFDLLYGTRYKFYGFLNYFVIMDKHTKNGGLINPYLNLGIELNDKNNLELSFHYFRLMYDVKKQDGTYYDKQLGAEIGLLHTYNINKQLNIKTGFYYGLPDKTLAEFKNVDFQNKGLSYYAYTMLTFCPKFFQQNK